MLTNMVSRPKHTVSKHRHTTRPVFWSGGMLRGNCVEDVISESGHLSLLRFEVFGEDTLSGSMLNVKAWPARQSSYWKDPRTPGSACSPTSPF